MANIRGRIIRPAVVGTAQGGRRIVASAVVPGAGNVKASAIAPAITAALRRTQQPAPAPTQPPILFFAETLVTAGGEVAVRSEALSNKTGRPVEIRELRFSAWVLAQGNVVWFDLGAVMSLRITVDGKPVTHGFIPFWCLGKLEQIENQVAIADTTGTDAAFASVVWRLNKPWYLRPGARVEVQLRHSGAMKYDVQGQIALAGHFASKSATSTTVPYAAAWVSPAFSYDSADTYDSSETDLANVTNRVVTIERIIGRVGVLSNVNASTELILLDFRTGAPLDYVEVRAQTSEGQPIIPDYYPFAAIFGYSRAIETPHLLEPGRYLSFSVKKSAGPTLGTAYTTWQGQAFVGIVGYREEDVR